MNFLLAYETKKRTRSTTKTNETLKSNTVKKIPDSVNPSLRAFNNINDLHPGVLLDHLNKINSLNKKLLTCFSTLREKYDGLSAKYDDLLVSVNRTSDRSPLHQQGPSDSTVISSDNDKKLTDLQLKLDVLEQKSYSNVLLINGPEIQAYAEKNVIDLQESVINKLKETVPEIKESDVKRVTLFGKNKQHIKVTCGDSTTKTKLIIAAKRKKSKTIFFSEFLTNYRNKLYISLRALKKSYPEKLTATYTRQGNIYYKLSSNDQRYNLLRNQSDLNELQCQISNE